MRLSADKIHQIKSIMKDRFNKEVSDEEAQLIGLATLEFVIAKSKHKPTALNFTEEEING
jgi:hypothetical protein